MIKSKHSRTVLGALLAVLAVLITLSGIFYFTGTKLVERKSGENIPQSASTELVESKESNNIPQPEEITPQKVPTYDEYLQQGIRYESVGELDKAIASYKKAAEVAPKEYVPYSNLGSIYERNKEFSKAEEAFKRALSIYGEHSRTVAPPISVYRKLYELYRYDLKQYPDQITLFFSDALEKTNNDVDLTKLYAFYLEDVNDLESALAVWKAFLQAEPGNEIYAKKVRSLEEKIKQDTD